MPRGTGRARFALRYKTLIEGRFDLVTEEEFPVRTVYDSVRDAIGDLSRGAAEQYASLTRTEKKRIRENLESRMTRDGIVAIENALLTAVRKRQK